MQKINFTAPSLHFPGQNDSFAIIISPELKKNLQYNGFGGREFIVTFNDGTVIKTNDLWCNGKAMDQKTPDAYITDIEGNRVSYMS